MRHRLSSAVIAACAVAACETPALSGERAALLFDPTPQCHAQLESAAGTFAGAPVVLGAQAFLNDATLTIEKRQPRDAAGRLRDGRSPGRPQLFRLVRSNGACVLVHGDKAERIILDACRCRDAPQTTQ